VNLKGTVRTRLRVSRQLLERKANGPVGAFTVAQDVIVSHEAAVLALTAICDQTGCLPHKSRVSLPDYLECLRKIHPAKLTAQQVEFFLDLHKTRVDVQNRAILPEPQRWQEVPEATFAQLERLCCQLLNAHFSKIDSEPELVSTASPFPGPPSARGQSSSEQAGLNPEGPGSAVPHSPPAGATLGLNLRRYPRYDCTGAVEVSSPHAGRPAKGKLLNISIGGCFAETDGPLEVGTRVEVLLEVNRLSFRAVGEVRMLDSRGGMGIEFSGMSAGGRQRLRELISELEEESGGEVKSKGAPEKPPSGAVAKTDPTIFNVR
jgi:PilZ domain-containing protein